MFKSFFKKKKVATNTDTFEVSKKIFSLACILVEAAMADENFGKDEKNIIVKIPKITVVPVLKKVDETIAGIIISIENGFEIPPVKYNKEVN